MLYEIRNYHIRPDRFESYEHWAKAEAIPHISKQLDVVGFWLNGPDPSQITGEPLDKLGSANVTWILRWRDMAHRDADLPRTFSGPAWDAIFARLPGGLENYLRMEAKFTRSLT